MAKVIDLKLNPQTGVWEAVLPSAEKDQGDQGEGDELSRNGAMLLGLPVLDVGGGVALAGLGDIIVQIVRPLTGNLPGLGSVPQNFIDAILLAVGAWAVGTRPVSRFTGTGISDAAQIVLLADAVIKVIDLRAIVAGFGGLIGGGGTQSTGSRVTRTPTNPGKAAGSPVSSASSRAALAGV